MPSSPWGARARIGSWPGALGQPQLRLRRAGLARWPVPASRHRFREARARIAELLPLAARLGVPVLAGTDVTGSIPREVALLAQLGLQPEQALAAASSWPRRFLRAAAAADIVTYHQDPRQDPDQLTRPAAVIAGGVRLR